jgi:hypothetical protein
VNLERRFGPGWPLFALVTFYPLWWALGLGAFAFLIFAVPMAWELRRRRPITLPPAFGLWVLFLFWTVASLTMIRFQPADSVAGSTMGRIISIIFRLVQLGACTIIAIYVINLPSKEVPTRRIIRAMSILFGVTVIGGLLALADPNLSFTSPLELILPHSIGANRYVHTLVHPQFAEVQSLLGYSSPRPAAPWGYTNFWGNNLSLLLPWICLYYWRPANGLRRLWLAIILVVSLAPIVYSLNRGVWIGILLSVAYLVYRLTISGDLRALLITMVMLPIAGGIFLATPLHNVVTNRTHHSGSVNIRAFADRAALKGAEESPILGWGGSQKTIGSSQAATIGPSPRCPNCGAVTIGSTGEFWELIFTTGFLGAGIYFSYFLVAFWRLRRDRTPIGAAARLVIILTLFYTYFYNNVPAALALAFISMSISWRTLVDPDPPPPPKAAPAPVPPLAFTTLAGSIA